MSLPSLPHRSRNFLLTAVFCLFFPFPHSLVETRVPDQQPIPGTRHTTPSATSAFLDGIACVSRGKWVRNPTPRQLPWLRMPWNKPLQKCDHAWVYQKKMLGGADADTAAITGANWTVREGLMWEWQAEDSTCPFEPFNREEFCRILGPGRSVLVVGDSINWGFYMALRNHMLINATYFPETILSPEDHPEWIFDGGSRDIAHGSKFCSEEFGDAAAVTIRFLRNSRLGLNSEPKQIEVPWVTTFEEEKPDVVILNRGAQFSKTPIWEAGVRGALKYVREKLPNALVIYRNTPPGHLNCTDFPTPLSQRQDPSLLPPAWNWDKFAAQNELAKHFVGDYGALLMDVDTMTSLRADGHLGLNPSGFTDCLHYCNPGPMDSWVRMLHNILKHALPPPPALPPRKKRKRNGGRGGEEGIRGSSIGTAEGARRVREEMQNISSEGKWFQSAPKVLPWPKAPVGAIEGCDKVHGEKGGPGAVFGEDADAIARRTKMGAVEWNVRQEVKYEWGIKRGGEGRLEKFNSTKMCRLLGPGASVLVVGDSLSLQFTKSVLYNYMAHAQGPSSMKDLFPDSCPQWHKKSSRKVCFGFTLCADVFPTKPVAIRFVLNRVLSLTRELLEEEVPWVTMLEEWKPTHVVLNRGLFYTIDEEFVGQLEETMEFLATALPKALVMYRSTAPGHLNCSDSKGPEVRYLKVAVPFGLHWAEVEGQNFLARQVVEARGGVYVDIETMTKLRPDGHLGFRLHGKKGNEDCLHYCQPGVIDTWVQIWFNALTRVYDEKWEKTIVAS